MCHDYFTSPDLLCDNPGVTMTSHVQSRSLLEYRVSILLAENKVLHFSKKNSQPTNLAYKKYTLA